ncbi:hypothetical protein [Candidatus Brachybacter algidus]|nr:hypothetical protein [Candidatus Brachybacter algidus]
MADGPSGIDVIVAATTMAATETGGLPMMMEPFVLDNRDLNNFRC